MAEPVRARRLTDQEGQQLAQMVRRGNGSIRLRRAMVVLASASGTPVPAIARLVQADEDTVGSVVHLFNEKGMAALDPHWAGGRPRLITDEDRFIVETANTRPETLGRPFTRGAYASLPPTWPRTARVVRIGRERLRQILHERQISFQRTRTWKESADPDKDAKLARIEDVTSRFPDGCFAFDEFGPLLIRPPTAAPGPGRRNPPAARDITARTASGTSTAATPSAMTSSGASRRRKSGATPRRPEVHPGRPPGRRPDLRDHGQPVREQNPAIRTWAAKTRSELCFTPTSASWANPIEAQFGPLRTFTMGGSNHPNHTVLARKLQDYLAWRNANARHPDVLAAQRRERARIRSERQQRWGRPRPKAA